MQRIEILRDTTVKGEPVKAGSKISVDDTDAHILVSLKRAVKIGAEAPADEKDAKSKGKS